MALAYLMYLGFFRIKTPPAGMGTGAGPSFVPLSGGADEDFEASTASLFSLSDNNTLGNNAARGHISTAASAFEIDSNPDVDEEYQLENISSGSRSKEQEQEPKTNITTTTATSSLGSTSAARTRTRQSLLSKKKFNYNYPPGYSPVLIVLLFALSWPILNLDFYFAQPDFITNSKDILAWIFYVLCHLIAPIVTAVYLYVFQPPGALMYFSMILGAQNISGVFTHLLFPNAPPWFIHLNGVDIEPTYEMPGFAAGLTRVDVAMGTHLNSKGFHKSPIVFGAFPSLHSAMAVQVFLHLNFYSKWKIAKVIGLLFVVIQWWATIYLDHHFRLDLFAGMLYAYFYFIVFQKFLFRVQKNFFNNYFFNRNILGTTMGMRVFKGTVLERFFDPYS